MKELYYEYFRIPKHGKIREKVMLVRVAITAFIMVFCLAAMSLTAYAYFSHNVVSSSNILQAAEFDVAIFVKDNASNIVNANEDGSYSLAAGTYSVTLEKAGTANTGFCIVDITVGENNEKYHTQQLGVDGNETRSNLQFTLDLTGLSTETATVIFTPHWGTSSHYADYLDKGDEEELYVTDGGEIAITVVEDADSANNSDDGEEATDTDTTASTETADTTEQTTTTTKQEETTTPEATTTDPVDSSETTGTTETPETTTSTEPVDTTTSTETQTTTPAETPTETTDPETSTEDPETSTETTDPETSVTETQTQPTETTGTDNEGETTDGGEAE